MHKAIYNTHPNVKSIINGVAVDENGNEVVLDDAVVNEELQRLETVQDATEYQRARAPQYPTFADQLDMLWHAIDSGSLDKDSDFYKSLKAVKDANPKG